MICYLTDSNGFSFIQSVIHSIGISAHNVPALNILKEDKLLLFAVAVIIHLSFIMGCTAFCDKSCDWSTGGQ